MEIIREVVVTHFKISIEDLNSGKRNKSLALPRQIAMYLCKNMTNASLDAIGGIIGGRDHSTIIHGITVVTNEYEKNESFHEQIETIKKKINPN